MGGKKRAFTLIELLVVVAIIALLMAILLPSLANARKQARLVACGANLRSIGVALTIYSSEYNNKMMPIYDTVVPWHSTIIWKNTIADSGGYRGLGLLVQTGAMANGKSLYCPAQTVSTAKYDYYTNWPREGYPYDGAYVTWAGYDLVPWSVDSQMIIPDLRTYTENRWPVVNDMICSPLGAASNLCHETKWNVLYGDGHVVPYLNGTNGYVDNGNQIVGRDFLTLITNPSQSSTTWTGASLMRLRMIPNF